MEQRIYFDDGKLVVETNNGMIKDGITTTQISGVFVANADTVAMLLSELEGHSLTMKYLPCWSWGTIGTGRMESYYRKGNSRGTKKCHRRS